MESIKRKFLTHFGKVPSKLLLYGHTDSTNERAKRYNKPSETLEVISECEITELDGGVENTQLFIADVQSAGRGRLGRSFVSPRGAGLYMSLRVRINKPLRDTMYVTPFAAVCAARAIERLCSAEVKIKWVNDLYIGDRKLAGILTESVPEECTESCSTLIIGIGINVGHAKLPPEVMEIAVSLEGEGYSVDRGELAAEITQLLLSGIFEPDIADILSEYRRLSNLIGERVTVSTAAGAYDAVVTSIAEGFELEVEHDGVRECLISADVMRIRKQNL